MGQQMQKQMQMVRDRISEMQMGQGNAREMQMEMQMGEMQMGQGSNLRTGECSRPRQRVQKGSGIESQDGRVRLYVHRVHRCWQLHT